MQLKPGDRILLPPDGTPTVHDSFHSPIWGGEYGYVLGTVLKTITHPHDEKDHRVEIRMDKRDVLLSLSESSVALVGDNKVISGAAQDYDGKLPVGPHSDVYLFAVKPGLKVLGVIRCDWSDPQPVPRYFLRTVEYPDTLVILSQDLRDKMLYREEELPLASSYEAYKRFCFRYGFPRPRALPLPLPAFSFAHEVIQGALPEGQAYNVARFHLTCNPIYA